MRNNKEEIKQELRRNEMLSSHRMNKMSAVRKLSHIPDSSTGQFIRSAYHTRTSSSWIKLLI